MPDINRETIESLSEKVETFAASLPPEEAAILLTTLANGGGEVAAYGMYSSGVQATFASSIGLQPGKAMKSADVAKMAPKLDIKAHDLGSMGSKV